jgi:hypothetical protein
VSLIALMDLFLILAFYVLSSLVFRFIVSQENDPGEVRPFWLMVEKFAEKFHVTKILYLVAAFFIIKVNVQIISETLISSLEPINIFMSINVLLVADVIAIVMAFGSKIALFKKETIEG